MAELTTTTLVGAIGAVFTVLTAYLIYIIKKREEGIDTRLCNHSKKLDKHEDKFEDMDWKLMKIIRTNMLNTQNNLMKSFDYYSKRDFITLDERRHIISMYEDHKATGGNGVTDKRMEKFLEIEVREPE